MNPQLTYLLVQARHSELICRAEKARLAGEARRTTTASSPRSYLGRLRLVITHPLKPARLASAWRRVSSNPQHECASCDP